MPDTKLYQGTIFLYDTETGERVNVAVQIAIGSQRMAYTIQSLVCDQHAPVTVSSADPGEFRILDDLLNRMRRVSVPA